MKHQVIRVLLVEHETKLRQALAKSLREGYSYQVATATDRVEAFRRIEEAQGGFDVVLIGEEQVSAQPPYEGIGLMKAIQASVPHIEFILFGDAGKKWGIAALRAGASRYVHAPIEAEELALLIEQVVEGQRLKAVALEAQDARKVRRLEQLAQASHEMMGNLENLSLDERLNLIAKHATNILDVESCGIWLVSRPGYLSLEASVGHREQGFQKSLEVAICSAPSNGLTAHIAAQGVLFNEHGDSLSNHPASKRTNPTHTRSGLCYSLLAMPLKSKRGDSEELLGLLRADNKKDNQGQIGPTVTFTQEDEWILQLFADAVVVAIEGAELVRQLNLEKERSARMIDSSPAGVVALTPDGIITSLSEQAAELMGYQHEEVLGEHVRLLYGDEEEPRRVGKLLHEATKGKLSNYQTVVHHKDGTSIPLRLSATWLYDAYGERIGSVGYFEDLRAIREVEQRLALLLKASNIVAQANNLTSGLQRFAEMLTTHLSASFCQILLLDGNKQRLVVQGAYLASKELRHPLLLTQWPTLAHILTTGEPTLLEASDHSTRPMLANLSWLLELPQNMQSLMLVPLQTREGVVGLLLLGKSYNNRGFSQIQRDVAAAIAEQTAVLIERMRLYERSQRMFSQLSILHRITDYMQATSNLDEILQVVLTGATAGYGLGFNRAALLLLDERCPKSESPRLVVRMAIGHLTESQALEDWKQHHKRGLEHFDRYLERLKEGQPFPTPLSEQLHGLRLTGEEVKLALFGHVIVEQKPIVITEKETLKLLPATFMEAFQPALPLAIVPLLAQACVIGLLVVDNKFTKRSITDETIEGLITLANSAAVAIEKTQLYQETEEARKRLRSFYEGSNALVSPQEPQKVLAQIVENAQIAARAEGVSMILIDEMRQVRKLIAAGIDEPLSEGDIIRPNGFSMEVMQTGRPKVITDTEAEREHVNPSLFWRQIKAAFCLPISLEGQPIGVMWFNYYQPREFSKAEIEAAQLYVNQATIAYDSARRIRELEHMRQAAQALAGAAGREQVLTQIVRSAREVLQADSAIIWSYDDVCDCFQPNTSVSAGLPDTVWQQFQKNPPLHGGITYTLMQQKWAAVHNIEDLQPEPFLSHTTRRLLTESGIHSSQGVTLQDGDEKLGLLYLNYKQPRHFSQHEKQAAITFANHATLALKKAKLLDQLSTAHNAARVVAEVMVLEESLEKTLRSVVEGIKTALNCDAITVDVYDQKKDIFSSRPIMIGLRYPERATRFPNWPKHSIIFEVIKRNKIYVVENVTNDPLFKKRRFTRDEGIASLVAIPLKVGGERVGVMFVNYRTAHRFTEDDLINIELFSNQAAVAIRNAQLYEGVQKRAEALEALYEAGRALTSSLELQELLNRLLIQAQRLVRSDEKPLSFASIHVVENMKAHRVAYLQSQGIETTTVHSSVIVDLSPESPGPIGITGRAILSGNAQLVADVTKDPDYLVWDPRTGSELAVPIKSNDYVIGTLNVEHPDINAFDRQDQQALEALAAQAAVAIENARLFEQAKKASQRLTVIHQLSTAGTSSKKVREQILEKALYEMVNLFEVNQGCVVLFDWEQNEGRLIAHYPVDTNPCLSIPLRHNPAILWIEQHRTPLMSEKALDDPRLICLQTMIEQWQIKSMLLVPLLIEGTVRGLIGLNVTERQRSFSSEEQELAQTMVNHVASAIENAELQAELRRRLEELRQTKEMLAGQSAVAWMGMISSHWRHAIEGHAITIVDEVELLRRMLRRGAKSERIEKEVAKIERLAKKIQEKPMTPPLSSEERVRSVPVNGLFQERLQQLQRVESYNVVEYCFESTMADSVTVRISPEWLRRVFDILIENAVEAVSQASVKQIRVKTSLDNGWVLLSVADTGLGIPEEVRALLFQKPIKREKGLGMGLLMAQTIAQTYGGEIQLGTTSASGTTIVMRLPQEQ